MHILPPDFEKKRIFLKNHIHTYFSASIDILEITVSTFNAQQRPKGHSSLVPSVPTVPSVPHPLTSLF